MVHNTNLLEDEEDSDYKIVPCRKKECGHVYCSTECEQDTWATHHYCLCTADCATNDDPLVQFKRFAVETNEILLLVAEWWVAQHTVLAQATGANEGAQQQQTQPYTDFVMNPWWDVLTADLLQQPGGFGEAAALQQQLRQVCQEAAELLSKVVAEHQHLPPVTALDIAVRIGACEQNAMGIRQRSPLCRDIFDAELRSNCHEEIVDCLEEAGFIGGEKGIVEKDGDDECKDKAKSYAGVASVPVDDARALGVGKVSEWDYTVDEIASYLSNLFMDEDRSVLDIAVAIREAGEGVGREREEDGDGREQQEFDDLDLLFPPLDGTAMYSIACKMNHSCHPNVISVYKRRTRWGDKHPLTVFAVALRDIQEGDELTISYIDAEQPFEQRQTALMNYGFHCQCEKCQNDQSDAKATGSRSKGSSTGDIFGSDSDDDAGDGDSVDEDDASGEGDAMQNSSADDGETLLQQRLDRLDTIVNHSRFGTIPIHCLGPVTAFLVMTTTAISSSGGLESKDALQFMQQCTEAVQSKDYSMCSIVGSELESLLFTMLKRDGQWPSTAFREAYWCGCLTAALGTTHDYDFVKAQNLIDKALILGLPRSDNRIANFIAVIEMHAAEVCAGPCLLGFSGNIKDYSDATLAEILQQKGLSQPIQFPIEETDHPLSFESFQSHYASRSDPVVIRRIGTDWPAVSKWRDLQRLAREHGHRLVPIELGSMMGSSLSMKEEIITLRRLAQHFLSPSASKDCWNLSDCQEYLDRIAYLAQHPLLSQISPLQNDLDMKPNLCGPEGPSHVYVWMGTGGTRTPLHFDSYDNLFVQLVGAKYVRLYSQAETPNLYVSTKSTFGLQGNMSDLDCEKEDWKQHGKAKSASYTEALLLPGDSLYIPARTWHYIRSLSTSISVNYWY